MWDGEEIDLCNIPVEFSVPAAVEESEVMKQEREKKK